jgi:hypothetical protein
MMMMFSDYAASAAAQEALLYASASAEQPPSPTASLWTEDATQSTKQARRRTQSTVRRSVCFAEDVKTHDGLTERNAIFDRLIAAYFVEQREISELDVLNLTGQNLPVVLELHQDLMDMAERISEAAEDGRQCAPVLPRGGGLCTKLCIPHLPYVRVLDRVVEAAANRLIKAQSGAA